MKGIAVEQRYNETGLLLRAALDWLETIVSDAIMAAMAVILERCSEGFCPICRLGT